MLITTYHISCPLGGKCEITNEWKILTVDSGRDSLNQVHKVVEQLKNINTVSIRKTENIFSRRRQRKRQKLVPPLECYSLYCN